MVLSPLGSRGRRENVERIAVVVNPGAEGSAAPPDEEFGALLLVSVELPLSGAVLRKRPSEGCRRRRRVPSKPGCRRQFDARPRY